MEYRKPGKQYSDELDTKIYGEGMVVYRINTAVQGNYRGDTDGIYVFRPGETALNAGQGDLTRSCYGGTNAPDSIGTTDLTKTFQDGALVYSDGTNSGIALDDIQIQPDGTLTFSASFADVSDRQLWQSVCDVPTSQELQSYDMCTGSDGSVYLASASDSGTVLYRLDGDTLTPVSTAISGSVYNPKLAFAGNTPYLLYQDDQYFLRLVPMERHRLGDLLYRNRTGTVCRHDCIRRQAVSHLYHRHIPLRFTGGVLRHGN